jgi:predicted AAA+ superfamily ATPase
MKLVERQARTSIERYTEYFPVTAILGPRQCGKTTLAKMWMKGRKNTLYLDLELPSDAAKLSSPEDFLRAHRGELVCLDEIQRAPGIFQILRALSDESGQPGQFLILGSASPDLLRQSSETLAGRIGFIELTPFTEMEVESENGERLWIRGGFPRSFLAPSDRTSGTWLENFIQTFLERDIPQLGIRVPSVTLRQFWEMCAHLHGDLWNHEKVASSLGVTGKTVRHYLDILEHAFMLRRLPGFQANVKKRIVKSPRVYLRDTGILHRLLRISSLDELAGHPIRGNSWEGYVLEQIAAAIPDAELFFYRTSAGAEIDLVIRKGPKIIAVEMKATSAPKLARGFWSAREDIKPDFTWIAAQVKDPYSIEKSIVVASPFIICRKLSAELGATTL